MIVYYLSSDHVSGKRPLPPVAFEAAAFHAFDNGMNEALSTLFTKWGNPSTDAQRPAATAWRFRRFRKNRGSL